MKHTFTLSRANRYLKKLRSEREEPSAATFTHTVTLANVNDIIALVDQKTRSIADSVNRHLTLQEDIENLKEALFQKNRESGVSQCISDVNRLKTMIQVFGKLLTDIQYDDPISILDLTPAYVEGLRQTLSSPNCQSVRVPMRAFKADEIKEKINSLRQQIRVIEARMEQLNSETSVSIDLSDVAEEILGLKS